MAVSEWSAWERLFARCVTDVDYRRRLSAALEGDRDEEVVSLLGEIGAEGASESTREGRVAALRSASDALIRVAQAFDADVDAAAP